MTAMDWFRVCIAAGVLTAFAERFYRRPVALVAIFALYVALCVLYLHHMQIGAWVSRHFT